VCWPTSSAEISPLCVQSKTVARILDVTVLHFLSTSRSVFVYVTGVDIGSGFTGHEGHRSEISSLLTGPYGRGKLRVTPVTFHCHYPIVVVRARTPFTYHFYTVRLATVSRLTSVNRLCPGHFFSHLYNNDRLATVGRLPSDSSPCAGHSTSLRPIGESVARSAAEVSALISI